MPRQQNGTATPLAGPVQLQNGRESHGNGSRIRPDGFAGMDRPGVPGKGSPGRIAAPHAAEPHKRKKPHAREPYPPRKCVREACKQWFTPKRPNQEYCPGDCRQRAYEERKVIAVRAAAEARTPQGPLIRVLKELARAPEELEPLSKLVHEGDVCGPATKVYREAIRKLYSRMVTLADKAASALDVHRQGHRSKK